MLHSDCNQDGSLNYNLSDDCKEILEEFEETKCNNLEERLVIINAALKTLKQTISKEKELWREEVRKTIDLGKEQTTRLQFVDYSQQLTLLAEAFLKSQAKIQDEINTKVYKQRLIEAENMCNEEMINIKNSLESLAPLQAIVNEWGSECCNDVSSNE